LSKADRTTAIIIKAISPTELVIVPTENSKPRGRTIASIQVVIPLIIHSPMKQMNQQEDELPVPLHRLQSGNIRTRSPYSGKPVGVQGFSFATA
jgi:hypothetical protein